MQLRHIAWESVKQRKARFGFVLGAVVLGIGTVVGLVSLTRAMQTDLGDELDRFGANIVVTPKSRILDLAYGGLPLGDVSIDRKDLTIEDAAAVRTIPNRRNISAVAPKLVGTTKVRDLNLVLIGTRFDQEPGIKSWWQIQGRWPRTPGEVLLGAEAAQLLDARVGTPIAVEGTDFVVAGTIGPTGSIDDQAVYVDLAVAQTLLRRPGAVTLIEVSALCRGCPIEDIVGQISGVLPHARVTPVRQAVATREQTVRQFTRFSYALAGLVLLVGTLVVMTTTMASVLERTQEIGILRAIGFRRTHVAMVVLLETLLVTTGGGVLGWIAGSLAARTFGPLVAQVTTPVMLSPELALLAIAFAICVGVAGGTYPALRAARMDPALALRQM
jgi:putative ABC transport system permease protein